MVVITETTFPFMIEIPTGEVEIISEGDVSQSEDLLIIKLRNYKEFRM